MSLRPIVSLATLVVLCGCMMGQDYKRPELDVPAAYRYAPAETSTHVLPRWWEQFNDPVLNELVETALEHNLDLRLATARLQEYQANYRGSTATAYPQVSLAATETRSRQGDSPITHTAQAYVSLAWELDFWGRIRRLSEAGFADYMSQEQARRAVVLSLVSSVASSYIQLREFDRRLEVARRTQGSRDEAQRLAALRYKVGTVSEMELKQATSEYQGTVINVQQLEQWVAQKENELSVLLGRNPTAIKRGLELDALRVPVVPGGLPSDLLTRRPDILQAEQSLIAANARVGAAKASFFPTISLTGIYGSVSPQLSDLFSGPSRMWSFAPTTPVVSLPVFNGGNLQAQLEASESRRDQALVSYQRAVQTAFRETEDALVGVAKTTEQRATQSQLVEELRRYAYLAKLRYDNGVTSNLEVLDSQRNLFSAEQTLAQTQSTALVARVNLYKALGGDWGVDAPKQSQTR